MNNCLTNALRKDMNLYRKYARAEAKYILSLGKNFALMDIELDIDDITFNKFIEKLAKEGICLDSL